eukprot:714516-Rhodomonas_salina.2
MSGTDSVCSFQLDRNISELVSGRSLASAYAMPGTDKANAAISLRACSAMPVAAPRVCYAMSGTAVAYGAVHVLGNFRMSNLRYPISPYARFAMSAISLSALTAVSTIILRAR